MKHYSYYRQKTKHIFIYQKSGNYNKNVSFEPDLNNAYDKAIKKNPDVIIAFGSLSYLGSFKKIVTDRAREAGNK